MKSFQDLNLIQPILTAVADLGYENPTPIQAQAIPHLLEGKDLLGCAQTGTGKTAAFTIPILQLLATKSTPNKGKTKIKALIVTPTRELAIQINESIENYSKLLPIKSTVIFGGVNQFAQVNALQKGVDILTATPGRLLDLIGQKHISLQDIEIFVLDEADRMLDMGFVHDVKKLLKLLPAKRQSLFFSATMPKDIRSLANEILHEPVSVSVTPPATTAETINQSLYLIDRGNKTKLLIDILQQQVDDSVLVFTRTKHGADKLVKTLVRSNIEAAAIHGNKSQNARQRALDNFKDKTIKVLVATDIAARGIDINALKYVINYEIPNIPESYVHRIGRGGRAGAEGVAISFADAEELAYIKDIEKAIGMKIPLIADHKYPMSGAVQFSKTEQKPNAQKKKTNTKPKAKAGDKNTATKPQSNNAANPNKPAKRYWKD